MEAWFRKGKSLIDFLGSSLCSFISSPMVIVIPVTMVMSISIIVVIVAIGITIMTVTIVIARIITIATPRDTA
jgi:hypothetical protein